MGACVSAQRGACTECTFSAQPGRKALFTRAPSNLPRDQGPGRPAAAVTSTPASTPPATKQATAAPQPRNTSAAILTTIGTPLAQDHAAQTEEPQGNTAPATDSSAAAESAAADGIVDWRPAPTATVTIHSPSTTKALKIQDTQYVAAENRPHDSASSTPRASTDYPARSSAVEADITATASPDHHDDVHPARMATAVVTVIPKHKTKGVTSLHAAAAALGSRLREERAAKSAAERGLTVFAMMAAHLERQLRGEQDGCSIAEDGLRDKSAALAAAQQLAADLACQLSDEKDRRRAAGVGLGEMSAALSAAEQRAADLERQLNIEQEAHAAQKAALRAQLAATQQQAADLACQVSDEQEARLAAQQAHVAAAAEADGLRCDLAEARLQVSAELASRHYTEFILQATLQQALEVEERVSQLETALQETQQQAAHAIAQAQAKCEACFRPPVFSQEALVGEPRPLGSGTFGAVYAQGLDLAFKIPNPQGDPVQNMECLAEEARLMSECRHPNILPLVGVIQDDSGRLAAIAMPRGDRDLHTELQKRCDATGCFALQASRVKDIGLGLTSAVFYLHNSAGIVHHDIKLGNILVMANGVPKVADFGLGARIQDFGCPEQQCSDALGARRGTFLESIHPYTTLRRWLPGPHDDMWALCMLLQVCVSGNDLARQQRMELKRLLRTDPAGLAEVDAACRAFGIDKPTKDERRAALQVMWRPQIQPREPGMEPLVQLLQLVLSPGLDMQYIPPADVLTELHNRLSQIPNSFGPCSAPRS